MSHLDFQLDYQNGYLEAKVPEGFLRINHEWEISAFLNDVYTEVGKGKSLRDALKIAEAFHKKWQKEKK